MSKFGLEWMFTVSKDMINPALTKMSTNFDKAKSHASAAEGKIKGSFIGMQKAVAGFQERHIQAIDGISSQLPGLGSNIALLSNPYAAAGAAALAAGGVMIAATQKAADFNQVFKDYAQLNLNAPAAQLAEAKSRMLELSMATGIAADKISTGFFDVQSILGTTGGEASKLVGEVGKFAQAMGGDVNLAISGAAKAMFNFKGMSQMEWMTSNFATFNAAKVNMNELIAVQAQYTGAVAKSMQSLDAGNKVFSAFSTITKDASENATLVKGAFDGLTSGSLDAELKRINGGMSMIYDSSGNMRKMDDIVKDMVATFKTMNPQAANALIEKIGGNEGLKALLGQAAQNGDNLLKVFDNFEQAKQKMDYTALLKSGNADFNTMKSIIGEQINTALIMMGEKILPYAIQGMQWLSNTVSDVVAWINKAWNESVAFRLGVQAIVVTFQNVWTIAKGVWDVVAGLGQAIMGVVDAAIKLGSGDFSGAFDAISSADAGAKRALEAPVKTYLEVMDNGVNGIKNALALPVQINAKPTSLVPNAPAGGAPSAADLLKKNQATAPPKERNQTAGINAMRGSGSGAGSGGGGITVIIQKMMATEKIEILNAANIGVSKIELMLNEILLRAVRDAELAAAH